MGTTIMYRKDLGEAYFTFIYNLTIPSKYNIKCRTLGFYCIRKADFFYGKFRKIIKGGI